MPQHPLAEVFGFPADNHSPEARRYREHRLCPFKGGILKGWGKKQAVAIDQGFFKTLPALAHVEPGEADIAWLVYDLKRDPERNVYRLTPMQTVYTQFEPALARITMADAGPVDDFIGHLQEKLDERLEENPPDAPTLTDIPLV